MQVKEFNYKGSKISYRVKGHGPLLVLLHGFGEDGTVWKNQYDIFSGHQLIIPDLPGSGSSDMIDDMSMEGMADMVYELILDLTANPSLKEKRVANSQPLLKQDENDGTTSAQSKVSAMDNPPLGGGGAGFTLIGHSMGGYITLAFAEKYPGMLNAFGLFHSTAFADSEEKKLTRKKGIQSMREHGGYEFLKTAIPNLYSPETKASKGSLIEEHLATVRNSKADSLVKYYEAMMNRPDRTEVLKHRQVPLLFVLGKYDTAVPFEEGLKLCKLPQLSYIHVLQNSGHMGMIEEEIESNKILLQFVTTVETIGYT